MVKIFDRFLGWFMIRFLFRAKVVSIFFSFALTALPAVARPRHPDMASLGKNSSEIFLTSMKWGDQFWDSQTGLARAPVSVAAAYSHPLHFMVRESSWYALGLLLRDQPGDRDRAAQTLRAVLKEQYHEPGRPWDGTFRSTPEEPEPGANAQMGDDFDPNWREFIGTTFSIILNEYPDRIPSDVARDMLGSVNSAVEGEIKEGRLQPTSTNIALMYGYLWNYAAVHNHRPDWVAPSTQWMETVYKLFKQHDAFAEYNSPTYAGVDLYALALWRDYGSTPRERNIGSEMEASLWRALADFYNPNLRNISGPYDRSYGMDMQSYVSLVGLWLRTDLDEDKAPLPKFDPPVDHVGDLWLVPAITVIDTRIPSDAMKSFRGFQGEHQIRRQITHQRIATAWIGKDVIYGGEITGHTVGVSGDSQFHPVTIQWQTPDSKIGWVQLIQSPAIDASADRKHIVISTLGDVSFRISAPGITSSNAGSGQWTLPGLTVHVEADSKGFSVEQHGQFVDLKYTGITRMILTIGK
jgi:hypothetical protein